MTQGFIALGSNLGDRAAMIDRAIEELSLVRGLSVVYVSSIYETEPVGPPQPKYLNAVCEVGTILDAQQLLDALQAIERRLGRVRDPSERDGPRTIDLDLLLLGTTRHKGPGIEVPHPRLEQRAFVLIPLLEIAPQVRMPGGEVPLGSTFSTLGGPMGSCGVAMWRARETTPR